MSASFRSLSSSTLSPVRFLQWIRIAVSIFLVFCSAPPFLWGSVCGSPFIELVVNEIMVDPQSVSDTHGEYLEIYNPGSTEADLNGWAIADLGGDYHVIQSPEPLMVSPSSYFVLARDSSSATNGGFSVDYQYSSFTLSNSSDEVILFNPDGVVIDSIVYGTDGFPEASGEAMELRNPGFDNVHGYNWMAATTPFGMGDQGTPGVQNSQWEAYKEMTLDCAIDSLELRIGDQAEIHFDLTGQSEEHVDASLIGDLWMPDGSPFPHNPLFGPVALSFEFGQRWEKILRFDMVPRVEVGTYRLIGRLLDHAGNEIDRVEVTIQVLAGRPGATAGTASWMEKFEEEDTDNISGLEGFEGE